MNIHSITIEWRENNQMTQIKIKSTIIKDKKQEISKRDRKTTRDSVWWGSDYRNLKILPHIDNCPIQFVPPS